MKNKIIRYIYLITGLLLVAIAFNLFLSPYNFVSGGVSGLAIVMKKVFNINESIFMLGTNILLIGISLKFLGKETTKNTILGSLLFPVFTFLTEKISIYIPLDLDPLLIAILGGALSGFGYGLIFKNNFTTGGTDILNQISEKYLISKICQTNIEKFLKLKKIKYILIMIINLIYLLDFGDGAGEYIIKMRNYGII